MTDDQDRPSRLDGAIGCGREPLVQAITAFLARGHGTHADDIRRSLERTMDAAGREAIDAIGERLADAGRDWSFYPGDPLARRIHHTLAPLVLPHAPVVSGTERLAAVAGQPVVIFANHLSYSDANLVEFVLYDAGARALANRLTVVAGPKVYSNIRRRFSSLCFGTIKVPQSTARSSEEAVMAARDVARGARRSIEIAHERLRRGDALLVFPEGSRSRSAGMQPFLAGAARYLEVPHTWVVPVAITGTERLFPLDAESLTPAPLTMRIGRPVLASVLDDRAAGDRKLVVDSIGFAVAALLPLEYRGVYGGGAAPDTAEARVVSTDLFS